MSAIREAEGYVLRALSDDADRTMSISEVVNQVRKAHSEVEVAHVKVAALNLVSRGRAELNADANLVAVEAEAEA